MTIRGNDLANISRAWTAADFNGDVLPTVLSGTSVRIGNRDAAIYYVSPTQINALIPPDAASGQTIVTVSSPVGASASTTISIDPFSPGFFMFDPENRRYVAAVLPDGTLAGKQGLFSANPELTRPVKAGQQVALYATGLGTTNPPVPPGLNFSDPRPMNGKEFFHVTVGGQAATVEFVGAVSPGLYQINIVAPVLPSGDYPVLADYAGFRTQSGAMLTIQGDPALSRLLATPTPLTMSAFTTTSTPATQTLQLSSSGEDFGFTLQSSATWLTFDTKSGRTPATILISADGRALSPGTYNEAITVLAPGTASPSTTIPIEVTVSNIPQISVSRTDLKYQLVTGYQGVSALINVLSDAGSVDYTVSKTGDTWLSVPSSGRTPGAVRVSLNSESRSAGTLTGSVRITPAGGGTPRDIAVSLTVLAAAPTGGPPQVIALDEDEMLWGRSGSFGLYGQNVDGATAVTVSPPQGVTLDSVKSVSAGRVNMNLAVATTAAEGTHTLTVTTSRGVSNAISFTIRRGHPQIRDLTPAIVNPGRFYATAGFSGSPGPALEFGMAGVDLQGITDFIIDPPDGMGALWSITPTSPVTVWGVMAVDANARPGTRRLSIATAGGRSNALTIEIRPASPNAPVISNLTLSPTDISSPTTRFSPAAVNYSGKLDFTDLDGDLTAGAKILLMADTGDGATWRWLVVDSGSYLEQKGKNSGTISFQFKKTFSLLYNQLTGKIPVLCMILDAAGNLSNTLVATVPTWQVAVF